MSRTEDHSDSVWDAMNVGMQTLEDRRLRADFFESPKAKACLQIVDGQPRKAKIITLSEPGDAIMDYGDFEPDDSPITFWDAIDEKDRENVFDMLVKIMQKGKPASAIVHWTTYPGRNKILQFNARPYHSPYYINLVEMDIRDITKREVQSEVKRIMTKRKKLRPFFRDMASLIRYTIHPMTTTLLVMDTDNQGFIVENMIESNADDYPWSSVMKKGITNIRDFPTLRHLSEKRHYMIWDDVNQAVAEKSVPTWKPHSEENPVSTFVSVLGYPIFHEDGRLTGYFFLSHMQDHYFQDRDARILQYLAPAMAEAINSLPN